MAVSNKTRPPVQARPKQSQLVRYYLIFYNIASTMAWGIVLNMLTNHLMEHHRDTYGVFPDHYQKNVDIIVGRAATSYDRFGYWVKVVQTFALLEPLHIALGLVRANLGTTLAQVASRLALVWGVLEMFPSTQHSPFYATMVWAWCISEIMRYLNYTSILMNNPSRTLSYLRYSLFYVLYPVGAGSEALHIWKAQDEAGAKYGPTGKLACQVLAGIVWPVSLAVLMSHMHGQRRKHLSVGTANIGKKRA